MNDIKSNVMGPQSSFSMGLMPAQMAQVVYLLPSTSGLLPTASGPANSGLTGPGGNGGGPAASFPGNLLSLQGGLPGAFFLPPQPGMQLPLLLDSMPDHPGAGGMNFIEPMSGRSNGHPWGNTQALLAPAPLFEDAAFSARGAPPSRPVPQAKSASPRENDSQGPAKSDGLQTLLEAMNAQTTKPSPSLKAATPKPAKKTTEAIRQRNKTELGAAAHPLKRCGRRPKDLSVQEFEDIYGPNPTLMRQCTNCGCKDTPQWRKGPDGSTTLCNRCGVQYRLGRMVPKKAFAPLVKIEDVPPHERPEN